MSFASNAAAEQEELAVAARNDLSLSPQVFARADHPAGSELFPPVGSAVAPGVVWRTDIVGDRIDLLVLAATNVSCVGIDLASGALVRAEYAQQDSLDGEPRRRPRVFDIAAGFVGVFNEPPDAAHPEAVMFDEPVQIIDHVQGWRAERYLRALDHPKHEPILGLFGPSVPFYELDGTHASMAIVKPSGDIWIRNTEAGLRVRFLWQHLLLELPYNHPTLRHAMEVAGSSMVSAQDLSRIIGYKPTRFVVGLSNARNGFCHKVVGALLPNP